MPRECLNIVSLRRTKYSDRHSILTAWSRERGRIALLVSDSAGRGASRARALSIVPSMFECEATITPGREIFPASSFRPRDVLASLRANPIKSMIATLMAEVLDNALGEAAGPDPLVSDFIDSALVGLDLSDDPTATANYHLYFIYRLGVMLGVEPDLSTFAPGRCFDMADGIFRSTLPLHSNVLTGKEAEAIVTLSRMTPANLGAIKMNRVERHKALDTMIQYLGLHNILNPSRLHSPEVFGSILS